MPPLKEYVFENSNSRIKITIQAYSLIQAFENLVEITKHPSDFKNIKP